MTEELPDDGPLVQAALAGDRQSKAELVERLMAAPRMLREINRRKGGALVDHDVEDLSQDVLILVWKKLQRFGDSGTLDPWLYRFCQLEFMNRFRSHQRRSEQLRRMTEESKVAETQERATGPSAESGSEQDRVTAALDELSTQEREIVRLRHEEGLTFPAMGKRLEESPEAVKARYYRALQALRRRLIPRPDHEQQKGEGA